MITDIVAASEGQPLSALGLLRTEPDLLVAAGEG